MTVTKTKTKKRALRARIGDLAIARFDDAQRIGIVTGSTYYGRGREYIFIYWCDRGGKAEVLSDELPAHRLTRARPKSDDWEGTLGSLTLDSVEPIYEGE